MVPLTVSQRSGSPPPLSLPRASLGPNLPSTARAKSPFDLPVHGLEVVADRRPLVERDVDRAVHRLDAALLERPLERQAHGAVDRRSARRAFDVRELDRAVDGVARERAEEARREDFSVAGLEADFGAGRDLDGVVDVGVRAAEIEEPEEAAPLGVHGLDPDLVAHLRHADLRQAERLFGAAARGLLDGADLEDRLVRGGGLDVPVDVLDRDPRDALHRVGFLEDLFTRAGEHRRGEGEEGGGEEDFTHGSSGS